MTAPDPHALEQGTNTTTAAPWYGAPYRGREMNLIEHDLARTHMRELQAQADTAARARRLIAARRWARRAERASRRAARASDAVW
ncbi:hypothetical protein SAMN05661080_00078 [Modestobacter sp. DSM 44400]|nr:hypothetical protein SAMN05661080_00078 [Modestobacter sp. DSM 44400]